MASLVSRLLVLGPDQDNNQAVVSKLQAISHASNPDIARSDTLLLRIQTKYYRAPVELHLHQVRDNTPKPVLQHELHEYEAIMCVVDAGKHGSFLHVQSFAKRIVDALPYDVCLLVTSTSSVATEIVTKMEKWCRDSGFEFIDLDATSELKEESVIEEKQGIERVLEALHCTMWRSMEMNMPKTETITPVKREEALKRARDDRVNDGKENEQGDPADGVKLQALLQALEIGDQASTGVSGHEDDVDMAQFSALIAEARTVRDQRESLTDEKRRERAAEVAMKLWTFLGAEDD